MDARKSLEKRLGDFLGFDDDDESLGDVLDQLLDIERESDLLDYIIQLLGSRSEEIKEFVKDITRFQKGQPIEGVVQQMESNPINKQQANKKNVQTKSSAKPAVMATQPPPPTTTTTTASENVPPSPANNNTKASYNPNKEKAATGPKSPPHIAKEEEVVVVKPKNPPEPPKKKYALPPRGKPKIICSCFGTLHKPLTNCLYCGRISCEEEGYDFCPFPSCGYLVEEVKPPEGEPSSSEAKAWQHKERLLRYDRESAKRTVVLDDQADYYSNQRSTWLTEEEQANAELQDDQQRRSLHQRKKQVLNIAF